MSEQALPTLLLVHGAWHGAWCWEQQFAPWLREQGHDVVTMDLPGHGKPGPERIEWFSLTDYADAVEAKLRGLGRPVIVAGHSMGGMVVQKLMERRPANLAAAVLVASAPPGGVIGVVLHLLKSRPLALLRTSLTADLYHLVRSPEQAHALFYSDRLPDELAEQYWQPLQNESFRAFLDMLALGLPKPRRADAALPKRVIGGGLDTIFPPDDVRRTAAAYGVDPIIYPDMAHNLMLDVGWEQVAEDLSEWVSGRWPHPG